MIYNYRNIFYCLIFFSGFWFSCNKTDNSQYNHAYSLIYNNVNDIRQWEKANSILKGILSDYENNDNFLVFYAISEFKIGNKSEAIKYMKKALRINSENFLYHYILADFYFQNNLLNETLGQLQNCLRLKPDSDLALILLVKADYKLSKSYIKDFFREGEAIEILSSKKFKSIPQALYILAAQDYHNNEMLKAFLKLKKAEKVAPNRPATLLNLAIICDIRSGQTNSSLRNLAKKYYSSYLKEARNDNKYLSSISQVKKRLQQLR